MGRGREAVRVTNVQREFLKRWAAEGKTAEEVLVSMGVPWFWFEIWVTHRPFRKALRKRVAAMKLMREMDVARGAEEGARRLSKAGFGNGNFKQGSMGDRRACVDLVQLAREMERQKRVEKRDRNREKERTRRIENGGLKMEGGGEREWSEEEAKEVCRALDEAREAGDGKVTS